MLVLRFKVTCQSGRGDEAAAIFEPVLKPSRALEGVVHFDVARALDNPDVLIATEVFENAEARARQEALPEVADVMAKLPGLLAGPPEATLFEVSSSRPAM